MRQVTTFLSINSSKAMSRPEKVSQDSMKDKKSFIIVQVAQAMYILADQSQLLVTDSSARGLVATLTTRRLGYTGYINKRNTETLFHCTRNHPSRLLRHSSLTFIIGAFWELSTPFIGIKAFYYSFQVIDVTRHLKLVRR